MDIYQWNECVLARNSSSIMGPPPSKNLPRIRVKKRMLRWSYVESRLWRKQAKLVVWYRNCGARVSNNPWISCERASIPMSHVRHNIWGHKFGAYLIRISCEDLGHRPTASSTLFYRLHRLHPYDCRLRIRRNEERSEARITALDYCDSITLRVVSDAYHRKLNLAGVWHWRRWRIVVVKGGTSPSCWFRNRKKMLSLMPWEMDALGQRRS